MDRRLLYIASTYSHIVTFHRPYLREFAARGWKIDVACGGKELSVPEADRILHIPFEKSISSPKNWSAMRRLRQEIASNHYELISCHTSLASFFARLAVISMKNRPLIACTAHGYLFDDSTPVLRRLLLSGAERITAPVTDLLMTMNRWDAEYARAHRLGKHIINIPGVGVEFNRLRRGGPADRQRIRQSFGFNEEHFLFIYAAEFSARKSQSTLIHALTKLPPQVGLLLPGDGALREECVALAHQLGLDNRIVFPGRVEDMPAWYAAADGAISSSRSEGLPFNIMEAMYCGLPVVATEVKGHTDLLRHEDSGLLFPYGSSEICARLIRRLLDSPELCRRLGSQARQDAMPYALEYVLPQIMAHYDDLLSPGP